MTTTDIGILLIVLCVVLWAIMAALHRHTVQLEALKAQMAELLRSRQRESDEARESGPAIRQHDNVEDLSTHASGKKAATPTRRTFPE